MSVSAPLAAIRAQHPLLHCISNIVSANDCANLALAIGASPIMAQAPQEMADIATLASAVVLNTGTPDEAKFTAPAPPVPRQTAAASLLCWTRWVWAQAPGGWQTSRAFCSRCSPPLCG